MNVIEQFIFFFPDLLALFFKPRCFHYFFSKSFINVCFCVSTKLSLLNRCAMICIALNSSLNSANLFSPCFKSWRNDILLKSLKEQFFKIFEIFKMFKIFHYRHIHVNFHLLWHWTSSTNKYILFFLYHIATANNAIFFPLNQKVKTLNTKYQLRSSSTCRTRKKACWWI